MSLNNVIRNMEIEDVLKILKEIAEKRSAGISHTSEQINEYEALRQAIEIVEDEIEAREMQEYYKEMEEDDSLGEIQLITTIDITNDEDYEQLERELKEAGKLDVLNELRESIEKALEATEDCECSNDSLRDGVTVDDKTINNWNLVMFEHILDELYEICDSELIEKKEKDNENSFADIFSGILEPQPRAIGIKIKLIDKRV